MSKPRAKRITVRLADDEASKLEKIAKKVAPKGTAPNSAMAVRNLIQKERL